MPAPSLRSVWDVRRLGPALTVGLDPYQNGGVPGSGPYGLTLILLGGAIGGLLAVAFLAALVVTLFGLRRWLKARRISESEGSELASLGPAVLWEVVSGGTLFSLQPMDFLGDRSPTPGLRERGRPILLVHGFLQPRASFAFIAPRLIGHGLGPLFSVRLPREWDLEALAEHLSARIDEIRTVTESAHIDVVAHSMGGILARMAERGRRVSRIRRLVTLGTPHQGTEVAHLAWGKTAGELSPTAAAIRTLPKPPPGQLISISSRHDFVVIPPERASAAPHGRDVVVRGVGHLGLLTDPEVSDEVVKALGEDILGRQELFASSASAAAPAV